MHIICPVHLILFDFITQIIFGEDYSLFLSVNGT
jgi:hypothetical protein